MKRAALLASASLTLMIPLVACGDDDDASGALSASEYRDAGNELCESLDEEVNAVLSGGQPTAEEVQEDLAPRLSTALSRLRDGLGDLQPPTDLAGAHAQLVSTLESAIGTLDAAVEDSSLAAQLAEQGPPIDELDSLARDLDLSACTADS